MSDCEWMGTINKWLHGVGGYMDAPPPAVPNVLFILYSINGLKYCFFPILLWLCMEMYSDS